MFTKYKKILNKFMKINLHEFIHLKYSITNRFYVLES